MNQSMSYVDFSKTFETTNPKPLLWNGNPNEIFTKVFERREVREVLDGALLLWQNFVKTFS